MHGREKADRSDRRQHPSSENSPQTGSETAGATTLDKAVFVVDAATGWCSQAMQQQGNTGGLKGIQIGGTPPPIHRRVCVLPFLFFPPSQLIPHLSYRPYLYSRLLPTVLPMIRDKLLLQELFHPPPSILSPPTGALHSSLRTRPAGEDRDTVHMDLAVLELSTHLQRSFHVVRVDRSV